MKKKLLSVLAVAAVSAVALVGCGGDEHTHDYKWKYEGDKHWQECACGEKTKSVDHEDKKINATGEAGEDELCDFCGADLHKHVYEWKSSAAVHWQECVCGDKKGEEVAHEDKKNNETEAEGADEKCDACGRGFYAVTFNMDGHGSVPTQHIGADGHAEQPETPADDDAYKFKGWYKDAAHKTAFDFANEVIKSATEVYAWFDEDKTPGASKKHAYALTLDNTNLQKAKKGEAVYYSYKAAEDGRYTISLPSGTNSANATFTTNLTGETKYGKGCDNEEVTVDIDKNNTAYILYTYTGEVGDDVVVSPLVTNVDDEPLPKDLFKDGEYSDGTISVEFTNEGKKIVYDGKEYVAKYIGGKYKSLYFVKITTLEVGGTSTETFYLAPAANGKYSLTIKSNGSTVGYTLEYVVPQPPVALSKILGYYEPVGTVGGGTGGGEGTITPKDDEDDPKGNGDSTGGIIGLYLYDTDSPTSVTVRYKTKTVNNGVTISYSDLIDASYNTKKNILTVNTKIVKLKLAADGSVEGLIMDGTTLVRKGDAGAVPPAKLDLADSTEYKGAMYTVRTQYGSQYFGATGYDGMTVLGYDEKTGMYTVDVIAGSTSVIYKMTVSQDKKTITIYDKTATTPDETDKKLDTLKMFEWNIIDLPTAQATDNVAADGFQKGLRLYKVTEAGWYSFTVPQNAQGWKNLNPYDYTNSEYVEIIQSGTSMYLEEGELIAVHMETPAAISVTVNRPEAPVGTSESNPKVLENGMATLDALGVATYYFTYTAPSAGNYLVSVVVDGYSVLALYTVNGTQYGYDGTAGDWLGGVTYSNPYAAITVENDLTLNIQVTGENGWQTVKVAVSEDYSENATDLTLTGTPANNSLTVTTTAATGANYHIASTKGQSVTVTGNAAFTVKVQGGAVIDAEPSGDAYTATIPAGRDVYFRLESDTQQTLTLSQTFAKGTEGYPNEVTLNEGSGTYTVAKAEDGDWQTAYISIAPGTYEVSAPIQYVETPWGSDYAMINLYVNYVNDASMPEYYNITDEAYVWNITVAEGDVLYIIHECPDAVELTFTKLEKLFEEEQVGTFVGKDKDGNDVKLTFDIYGKGVYVPYMEYDINIKQEDQGYSFTYDGDGNSIIKVTFSLDGNTITLTDPDEYVGTITMTKYVQQGTAANPEVITLEQGAANVSFDWTTTEYYIVLPAGKYSFSDNYQEAGVYVNDEFVGTVTGTITVQEGDVVKIIGGFNGADCTFTATNDEE